MPAAWPYPYPYPYPYYPYPYPYYPYPSNPSTSSTPSPSSTNPFSSPWPSACTALIPFRIDFLAGLNESLQLSNERGAVGCVVVWWGVVKSFLGGRFPPLGGGPGVDTESQTFPRKAGFPSPGAAQG